MHAFVVHARVRKTYTLHTLIRHPNLIFVVFKFQKLLRRGDHGVQETDMSETLWIDFCYIKMKYLTLIFVPWEFIAEKWPSLAKTSNKQDITFWFANLEQFIVPYFYWKKWKIDKKSFNFTTYKIEIYCFSQK